MEEKRARALTNDRQYANEPRSSTAYWELTRGKFKPDETNQPAFPHRKLALLGEWVLAEHPANLGVCLDL